jgi:hypothetical protein
MALPAKLFRTGASLLVLALLLGLTALIEPISDRSRPWFGIFNWTASLIWLAAAATSIAAFVALIAWSMFGASARVSMKNLSLARRIELTLCASWVCSFPHAYLRLPHYKEALPLYLAGIAAYAAGHAFVVFFVCMVILLLAHRTTEGGVKFALTAAVIVNVALLLISARPLH